MIKKTNFFLGLLTVITFSIFIIWKSNYTKKPLITEHEMPSKKQSKEIDSGKGVVKKNEIMFSIKADSLKNTVEKTVDNTNTLLDLIKYYQVENSRLVAENAKCNSAIQPELVLNKVPIQQFDYDRLQVQFDSMKVKFDSIKVQVDSMQIVHKQPMELEAGINLLNKNETLKKKVKNNRLILKIGAAIAAFFITKEILK